MELDVYLPDLNLAIEYQGQQHYKGLYWITDLQQQESRDHEKEKACIEVPLISCG